VAQTVPPVLIELQLETAKIAAQMQQITGDFQNFGKTVEKQGGFLAQFKSTAAGVFAGDLMGQGLNMIKTAISGAIKDAQEYEVLLSKTAAVIESTGNAASISVEGLKQHASALENISGVDENLILNGENVIATFTNIRNAAGAGNDIFNQTTVAALDLSVALGQDMQSSAVQLGKALNDPIRGVTALQRVGVVFTAQQKEAIKAMVESGNVMGAQKIILAEMNREFGGAAAAAGDTFAGAIARAKDKVSDFGRDLVTNVQPILLSVGKAFGDFWSKYLSPVFTWVNKNKEALLIFVGVLTAAYVAMKTYNAIMIITKTTQQLYAVAQVLMSGGQLAAIASTNGLAASMLKLNATMYANPVGLIVAGIALLAAGFVIAWNHSKAFREIMITVGKAGLTALSFIIQQVGTLAVGILKVVTGPMRLLLKGLDMLGVKGAGSALKEIDGALKTVGTFFDGAAKKVESYKKTLDGLADKKITLPKFGKPGEKAGKTGEAELPGEGKTAEQIKAEKAAAKQRVKDIEAANKQVVKIYDNMNETIKTGQKKMTEAAEKRDKAIADAKKRYADLEIKITQKKNEELAKNKLAWEKSYDKAREDQRKRDAKIEADYIKKKESIEADYIKRKTDLNASAQDKIAKATASAAEKQASIVQKSIDRLTSAFASGTAASISQIFKDGAKTADDVIAQLKTKLVAAKELQANAGALAAAGYSQVFIEDIVKQGPVAGNEMAKALLSASADTRTELQGLYAQVDSISETGLDDLSKTMNAGARLATQALIDEYNAVPKELAKSIAETNNDLTKALSEANANYLEKLAEAATMRNEALADSKAVLNEALAAADEALADANKATLDEFTKAIQENKDALAEKLKEIQLDYDDAIAQIAEATKEKLQALQDDLQATIDKLKELGAAKDAATAAANSPASSYISPIKGSTGITGDNSKTPVTAKDVAMINYNYNTNVTGVNMTDPSATARAIDNTVRFGATQGLATR
jgi:hypothetical protein